MGFTIEKQAASLAQNPKKHLKNKNKHQKTRPKTHLIWNI